MRDVLSVLNSGAEKQPRLAIPSKTNHLVNHRLIMFFCIKSRLHFRLNVITAAFFYALGAELLFGNLRSERC